MNIMDALNVLMLEDIELIEAYELFNSRTNMLISKNDGLFNNNFNLIKDQLICLHQFTQLGRRKKKTIHIKKRKKENVYDMIVKDEYVDDVINQQKRVVKIKKII